MLENGDLKSVASEKLTISFAGGGFLAGAYHLGVVLCLQECAPQFLSRIERFFGTSCGAMIAAWAACGLKIEILYKSLLQNVEELCSSYRMKSLNPTFDFYARMYRLFDAHFPQDVHRKLRGRFMTSMTSVPAFRSVYVSNFNTRKELFNVSASVKAGRGRVWATSRPYFFCTYLAEKIRTWLQCPRMRTRALS